MYTVGYKGTIVSVPKGREKECFADGGKFDPDFKCFYFTDDDTPETFDHWFPENAKAIITGGGFYMHEAQVICPHCHKKTYVVSLAAQSLHTKKEQDRKGMRWEEQNCLYAFHHIRFIPFPIVRIIQKSFPQWDYLLSSKKQMKYWGNKCQHCGTLQEDSLLFNTVFGTFDHEYPKLKTHCIDCNDYGFPIIAQIWEVDLYGFDDGDGNYSFYRWEGKDSYSTGNLCKNKQGKWYEEDRFW